MLEARAPYSHLSMIPMCGMRVNIPEIEEMKQRLHFRERDVGYADGALIVPAFPCFLDKQITQIYRFTF